MKYLTLFLIASLAALPACPEKSDDTGSDTGNDTGSDTGSSGTTNADPPTSTTGDDPTETETTTTTEATSTSGESTADESTAAATGSTTGSLDEDCAFLIGKTFVSKKQFPCGPPQDPNDPGPLCPDRVSFKADTFLYMSSDYGVGGTYTCEAGVITGEAEGEAYAGTIDAAKAALVWQMNAFDVEP